MYRNGILLIAIACIAGGRYFSSNTEPVFSSAVAGPNIYRAPAQEPERMLETLQTECMQSKPDSCFDAGWQFHEKMEKLNLSESVERIALEARSIFLWRKGCLASKHSSCDSLMFFGAHDDKDFATMQLKKHCSEGAQGSCTVLTHWLIQDPNTKSEGLSILNHQCQHRDDDACEELGRQQIKTAETESKGIALLNTSCDQGRISACSALVSLYADSRPDFSLALIQKVEKTCRSTRAISACEYLADLYSGEQDSHFKNIELALPLEEQLCDLGITRNCATFEKLKPGQRQAVFHRQKIEL